MWLADTWTGEFVVKKNGPRYAILSHVWKVEGKPSMSEKIRRACAVARAHGYRSIWVDSCCIDKTSSAELSEAINSMFAWYRDASSPRAYNSYFRESMWFTRGWTLQELLAPAVVIETKSSLASLIALVTTIPTSVLLCTPPFRDFNVARRMSWASKRSTTRVEDEAYSLLSIFDINMPTLYGEGSRAFRRLQEEILRRIPDDSIFAWFPCRCPLGPHPHVRHPRDSRVL
ncbi:HET-domain-containing protein [Lentinus brumalis]|uniref:HET-domain-containing protein n=1 Tax=Lentinus brumalis TaxID=2498619 RepID=A0A371CHD5_9APHY|nr:HET-domain-containing protein [Polyporus brumalis]